MTEPTLSNEYMDTGALTPEAVPEPAAAPEPVEPAVQDSQQDSFEEPAPVAQPPVEAPGSPSSAVVDTEALPSPDGSGPTESELPEGAEIFANPEDAEPKPLSQDPGAESGLPSGAQVQ